MIRLGIDIGGTFTDFALWLGDGQPFEAVIRHKTSSSPPHFAEAVKEGVRHLLAEHPQLAAEPVLIVHGMTVGTNTVIERSGTKLGLLVTRGFRDVLEIARMRVPKPLNFFTERPPTLIAREFVREVGERMLPDGRVLEPLDTAELVREARALHASGIRALVVGFLHSHVNPAHEEEARATIAEALPDTDVVLSHEVWPLEGEYERAMIALLNAYVKPVMSAYLADLEAFLAEVMPRAQLMIASSNGGVIAAAEARRYPVHTLLSGPSAGVTATSHLGAMTGRDSLLTMDMGGTSTDMSIVADGRPTTASQAAVGDFPLTMPVTSIEAMGAGGGSVIWLDGKVLRVGPRSAGAWPGPACYGRGGSLPTLSDAYLICGYLGESLLGGALKLDLELARAALQPIADALSLDLVHTAEQCVAVATANMMAKALPFLARMGLDPDQPTLVPFGGAGAIHGPLLARELGVREILVPPLPSVFCAAGCVVSHMMRDFVRAIHGRQPDLAQEFAALELSADEWLDAHSGRISVGRRRLERYAGMRYMGQSFQIEVPLTGRLDSGTVAVAFHQEHRRIYSHADPSKPVEVIELRLRIVGELAAPATAAPSPATDRLQPAAYRPAYFDGRLHDDVPVYERSALPASGELSGPAILEQPDSTVIVPPDFMVRAGAFGELHLTRRLQ